MLYGSIILVLYISFSDVSFSFDTSFSYVVSLIYLAVVASVIGFGVYLKLVGNIGADKASYVNIFTPTIALLLSTLFENYQWSWDWLNRRIINYSGKYYCPVCKASQLDYLNSVE